MVKDALIKELFLKNFKELLQDLAVMYPNDTTLRLCLLSFNTVKTISPDTLIKETKNYLAPYKKDILERNEEFLMDKVEQDLVSDGDNWVLNEMKRVKSIWQSPNTSDETRQCIWNYLTNFVKLGDKISM